MQINNKSEKFEILSSVQFCGESLFFKVSFKLRINMGRDNRRISAPDNCTSTTTFAEQKERKIINENRQRNDGRSPDSLKHISLQVGIVPQVSGSAYLEIDNTKIICSVNGPRDVLTKGDPSAKGQLFCEFKFASFSRTERQGYVPSDEEQSIAKSIQEALEPVILLHKFPKSRLDISIIVLEDDGGAVSAAIMCAGAALSHAGVEIYDLPIGCSLVCVNSEILLDPTSEEESYCKEDENCAKISLAMMVEYKSQVVFMQSWGCVNQKLLKECLKLLQASCQEISRNIQQCLKQHVEDMRKDQADNTEGTLCKKMEAQLKLFQPRKYITTHLQHDIRPGGRQLPEFRPVLINTNSIGTANGSALVRLGDTSVLCAIKAELTNPLPEEPDRGFFVPNVTLTPVCSNRYVPGPPGEQAQVYSQLILELWKHSNFIHPTDLCIAKGQLSWCLFAEMLCVSCDGNVLDACVLALMAAIRNAKVPEVIVDADTNSIKVNEEKLVDLKVSGCVFSTTFAVVGQNVLSDPSSEEELLADSSVTVFLKDGTDVSVNAYGPVDDEQLLKCIDASKKRFSELMESLAVFN